MPLACIPIIHWFSGSSKSSKGLLLGCWFCWRDEPLRKTAVAVNTLRPTPKDKLLTTDLPSSDHTDIDSAYIVIVALSESLLGPSGRPVDTCAK